MIKTQLSGDVLVTSSIMQMMTSTLPDTWSWVCGSQFSWAAAARWRCLHVTTARSWPPPVTGSPWRRWPGRPPPRCPRGGPARRWWPTSWAPPPPPPRWPGATPSQPRPALQHLSGRPSPPSPQHLPLQDPSRRVRLQLLAIGLQTVPKILTKDKKSQRN